ncbi:dTDP-6-deoxy-L-lyxo-4-hexulose reductase [Gordonia polyisoprenivorans NBRC 16320 = JCM 10675]|uniref:dTDP-4-dehydrorhamnose reductase n=1 Tax=Gordonia polyisoprenivorans TaxID=84595 RepID=A0A846WJV1_9ACTN|nr:sugar nucleotide-binding protein [Gordonia polyisoprenivorans]NKY01120.1 sugar nucleotide-binding protein [Gordonia polyisoprenivorans]OZC29893.1 NAD(P)-dependent oxidoreductase [Gordonia polyisoprenivorans]UZF58221.1 NAD(P)-dependent oxidoreductase [Gordonia polyisoprenivorans]GAB20882.1 dTDP-6-deoxy-L-lyxo-4-hexulose reductase [Gordonia polyisoprenivorans NBRC 16320 = JCM 10675]
MRSDSGIDPRPAEPIGTVWLLGAAGQLGTALRAQAGADIALVPLTSADVDLADASSIRSALAGVREGDVVLNTAAYTAVDQAESEPEKAAAVNAVAPGILAEITAASSAWLIHVSTDYVFAGTGMRAQPLEPDDTEPDDTEPDDTEPDDTEPDDTGPESTPPSVYGATKLAGERAVLAADPSSTIVRTAWVYTGGPDSPDFVGTMRRLEQSRDTVSVVDDQVGSPTYAPDLAAGLWELTRHGHRTPVAGAILHATNAGAVTWYAVARAVFAGVGADPDRVRPCTTAEFPRPAPRPAYSVLSPRSWRHAGLTPLREWSVALADALDVDAARTGTVQAR